MAAVNSAAVTSQMGMGRPSAATASMSGTASRMKAWSLRS